MNTVAHIKTARVTSHKEDGSAIVERTTIKIEIGRSFNNFLKHINLKSYMTSEPPEVVKVLENSGKGWKEIDKTPFQNQVAEALKPVSDGKVDYKALAEKQAAELESLKASFESRFTALENIKKATADADTTDLMGDGVDLTDRQKLETEADSLGITYQASIGDVKLLARIHEINPEF